MSGAPTLEQLKTVEIFRKKIHYLEQILKKFYSFQYSRGDTLYYTRNSDEDESEESEDLALRSPTREISLRSLPGAITLKFWWNREDIIVNKTDMNDLEYSKYIQNTNGGRILPTSKIYIEEGLRPELSLYSKFAPHCVISSCIEALQYDPGIHVLEEKLLRP